MSRWERFWRALNPPLPDVMQVEMLRKIPSNRPMTLGRFVGDSLSRWNDGPDYWLPPALSCKPSLWWKNQIDG